MKHFAVHRNFYTGYRKLREEFTENFRDAKSTQPKRFVWDFWYDEDRYHLIRTPAYHYFSPALYRDFHSHLVQWGRENLGCHDISPPWLSYYVDGCYQNLHSDMPHGPWAFVYSLTPQPRAFRGGETLILKPTTLDYWGGYRRSGGLSEYDSFVERIPPALNQLTVFDPRLPHGVTEVKGTRDPLKSRLVLHGWFVNPRPYVTGGLGTAQVTKGLRGVFTGLERVLGEIDLLDGALSVRLRVSPAGAVTEYKVLTDTLLSLAHRPEDARYLRRELKRLFQLTRFPAARTASRITVPLIFK